MKQVVISTAKKGSNKRPNNKIYFASLRGWFADLAATEVSRWQSWGSAAAARASCALGSETFTARYMLVESVHPASPSDPSY